DAVIVGEGEAAFERLCTVINKGGLGEEEIPSVIYRSGGGYIGSPDNLMPPMDLDDLPIPARELLELEKYTGAPTPGLPQRIFRATQLFTNRGCPGKCIFCCSSLIFGRKVRARSVPHIMNEVRDCIDRFGFRHFTIDNDTFTYNRDHVLSFCGEISKLGVSWDCDTRVDRVDREMLRIMADSGCKKVAFGVESGSPRVLGWIKKGITIDHVKQAFGWARETGMLSCAFFMIGNHPDETIEDIRESERLIKTIDPDLITVAIAVPYPGTALNEIMKEQDLIGDLPWSRFGKSFQGEPVTRTKTLSPEDLKRLQSRMLRGFFLRPGYILRRLSGIRSFDDAMYWFGAGIQFLSYIFSRRSKKGI
ncbi:MAG TPA: radical SAM protein, partial [bacterium]|nr:radical SAM protein [bacterium]